MRHDLDLLFRPRRVALVGASADPAKTAGLPLHFLRQRGFDGDIYPVNPRATAIDGLPCYPSIDALPETPDVALVLLGTAASIDAVRHLAVRGVKYAIVLASGFGETGEAGRARQAALLEAAGLMRILGPNTIGLVNVTASIPLSASGALAGSPPASGPVGVVSQSGGILGSLLSRMAASGIGLSKLVATSNEADLEMADFIDYLADDPATTVIALYVETIRHPNCFRAAAQKARAAGKPIVALKIGRSEAGARAAASHTGAMAGSDRVYDAFFADLGITRAQTFGELVDLPVALATQPRLKGKRIAVLTSTGGAGTLIADTIGLAGFEAPPPDAATTARLTHAMPAGHGALDGNPIDLTLAGLRPDILSACVRALLESDGYDALAMVVGSSSVGNPLLVSDALRDGGAGGAKPIIAYVSPHAPAAAAHLTEQGIPAFSAPETVAAALSALWRTVEPVMAGDWSLPIALAAQWCGSLDERQAKSLFTAFGIQGVGEMVVTTAREAASAAAKFRGKVVLKILSADITHKSDVGGVEVGLDAKTIGPALETMRTRVHAAGHPGVARFLVQEMVSGGVEMILGCRRDPLGAVLLLGMGGVAAELANDTALRLVPPGRPLSSAQAHAMMRELRLWPLLDGYRGSPKRDTDALATAIVGFSTLLAHHQDRLIEAEINPLFVLPAGQGVRAADGVALLTAGAPDAGAD